MFPESQTERPGRLSLSEAAPWLVWAGCSALYLALLAAALEPERFGVWSWPAPLALAWLTYLHGKTQGETSPVAALTFILTGPTVCVAALFFLAARERVQVALTGSASHPLSNAELFEGAFLVGCVALFLSGVVAFVYARLVCDLWPARQRVSVLSDIVLHQDPNAPPPKCLAVFALDWTATPEELDAAYRALALSAHPDRGGSEDEFKQLEEHYERAKKYLRHGRPSAKADQQGARVG